MHVGSGFGSGDADGERNAIEVGRLHLASPSRRLTEVAGMVRVQESTVLQFDIVIVHRVPKELPRHSRKRRRPLQR